MKSNASIHFFAVLTFILTGYVHVNGQLAQSRLDWVIQSGVGGSHQETDKYGNIYAVGIIDQPVDFNNSSGVNIVTPNLPTHTSMFVSKRDRFGNLIWVKLFSYEGSDAPLGWDPLEPAGLAVGKDGAVYIVGDFRVGYTDEVDFDPGPGVYAPLYGGNADRDAFVLKLNSNGELDWVHYGYEPGVWTAGGWNKGQAIALDKNDNVFIAGYTEEKICFGGPSCPSFSLYPSGYYTTFLSKLNKDGVHQYSHLLPEMSKMNIVTDQYGSAFLFGEYNRSNLDFNPSIIASSPVSAQGSKDIVMVKFNKLGAFQWVKQIGGTDITSISEVVMTNDRNMYVSGAFTDSVDFDPGPGTHVLTNSWPGNSASLDYFLAKYDKFGDLLWVIKPELAYYSTLYGIDIDSKENITIAGSYYVVPFPPANQIDFDPGPGTEIVAYDPAASGANFFLATHDSSGQLLDVLVFKDTLKPKNVLSPGYYEGALLKSGVLEYDLFDDLLVSSGFYPGTDLDPGPLVQPASGLLTYPLTRRQLKLTNGIGVYGRIFQDYDSNCQENGIDVGMKNWIVNVSPGNYSAYAQNGTFFLEGLPNGTYSLTVQPTSNWQQSCPGPVTFSVATQNAMTIGPNIGMSPIQACSDPDVTISIPFIRRCFSNQQVYVNVYNSGQASGSLNSPQVDLVLDSLFQVDGSNFPFTIIAPNTYRFQLPTIPPAGTEQISVSTTVSCNAVLSQTLCAAAFISPVDSCVLDTIPNPFLDVQPCPSPWDSSSVRLSGVCDGDTIRFLVENLGVSPNGGMTCFAPVHVFVDGQLVSLDSVMIGAGQSKGYAFWADGRTWRIEVGQHPRHPGDSRPNFTVERCGDITNWTPGLFLSRPLDDNDPVVGRYCGLVTGSFDPNDKKGIPLGVGPDSLILPNQKLDYMIRFQNTGTDTAFKVVIRDTLDPDFDIFSLKLGPASHPYVFELQGKGILVWTFDNILLPDSTTNLEGSNGFVSYKIKQNPNLSNGTLLNNTAAIYFDFNDPIITNTTNHQVDDMIGSISSTVTQTIQIAGCGADSVLFKGMTFSQPGNYLVPALSSSTNLPDTIYDVQVSFISVDTIAPVPDFPALQLLTSQCGTPFTPIPPTATDLCEGQITATTSFPFPVSLAGTYTINWEYDDGKGNISTQPQALQVLDVNPPVPDSQSLPTASAFCEISSLPIPSATDVCEGMIMGVPSQPFPITTSGMLTWSFTDNAGNVSYLQQAILIQDSIAPIPLLFSLPDILDSCSVQSLVVPKANDNCGGQINGHTLTQFPVTDTGTTIVVWIFDDGNGNLGYQNQKIIIHDTSAPIPQVANLDTVISYCSIQQIIAPTAIDDCTGPITGTSNLSFPIVGHGVYHLEWTYDDGNGNKSSQTQVIQVIDTVAPQPIQSVLPYINAACTLDSLETPTAIDDCNGPILAYPDISLPVTEPGPGTIIWTFEDSVGNSSTLLQDYFVLGIDPTLTTSSSTMTANEPNGYYQWIDCSTGGTPIAGETEQSFTPEQNGNYAVVVSNGFCTDTSDCIEMMSVSIDKTLGGIMINVQPNPTSGLIGLHMSDPTGIEVSIYDGKGKLIDRRKVTEKVEEFDLSGFTAGIYLLKATNHNEIAVFRIIKE